MHFRASATSGTKRGTYLGKPTINLRLEEIPNDLPEGIYACRVTLEHDGGAREGPFMAAVHYGPRPVFKDTASFELHVIDVAPSRFPNMADVTVVARLRDVRDFPSVEALMEQIGRDVERAKFILAK